MDARPFLPLVVRTARADRFARCNQPFAELTGYATEELRAGHLLDWIHPEDRPAFEACLGKGRGHLIARHRTRMDEWVAFDWQVRLHDGEVVVCGRPPLVEEPVDSSPPPPSTRRGALSETLDAMARIVEGQNPGLRCSILLTDPRGEFILGGAGPSLPAEYNRAVEGLRIGPGVGSCGTAAYWNTPVVVEDISADPLWRDLRDAAGLAGVAACWSHPITSTTGEVMGAMALYADEPSSPSRRQMNGLQIAARMVGLAVERDRLEEQLRQSTKMEAIGLLAGGVAHDFNNLLTVILGNAELAMSAPRGVKRIDSMLQEIVTASMTAAELCSQLLAYAGRGALTAETFEANAMIRELGSLLRIALSKKATLDFDLSGEPLGLHADRTQLRQVVMNLITNASEAIGDQPGTITIRTRSRTLTRKDLHKRFPEADLQPGEYMLLTVADTGVGMTRETQARIFDPFFTTKELGEGLGLAAVQGIVRRHAGTIVLHSIPHRGTEFTVVLPLVTLPANVPTPEPPSDSGVAGATILVVDDEPSVRKILASTLGEAGYRVLVAEGGREAIATFRRRPEAIDLVLLDLSMPDLDGEEVFRELRKIRPDVQVILSSGFAEREVLRRFEGAGLAGFVHKPVRTPVLLGKIAAALGRSNARSGDVD